MYQSLKVSILFKLFIFQFAFFIFTAILMTESNDNLLSEIVNHKLTQGEQK